MNNGLFPTLLLQLALVAHILSGLIGWTTGVLAFCAPKRRGRHHRWGKCYLWAYTGVFLTTPIFSGPRWYIFAIATVGYGLALGGYGARRFRQKPLFARVLGKRWIVAHIVGVIGSYVALSMAFFVANAHAIPGLKELPALTFWVLPTIIALPFLVMSLARFTPETARYQQLDHVSE